VKLLDVTPMNYWLSDTIRERGTVLCLCLLRRLNRAKDRDLAARLRDIADEYDPRHGSSEEG
jgi:hypothetical protein